MFMGNAKRAAGLSRPPPRMRLHQ